jgi:p-cumate 2,3-dioxygenase subunit beta
MDTMLLKDEVERFLFDEAGLLDKWKLKEWEALFTPDGEYLIPPMNIDDQEHANPTRVMFLIEDNHATISARTDRMLRKDAYVESPRSRIRHLITNVRIVSNDGQHLRVSCNLVVYRARRGQVSTYVAETFYNLLRQGNSFRIREKRVCLDNDVLQPQGSLAIIL